MVSTLNKTPTSSGESSLLFPNTKCLSPRLRLHYFDAVGVCFKRLGCDMRTALAQKYPDPESTDMAQNENAELATQVAELRADVRHVQADVTDIKADLRSLNQRMEAGLEKVDKKSEERS